MAKELAALVLSFLDAVRSPAETDTAEGGKEGACPPRRLRRAQSAVQSHLGEAVDSHRVSRSVGRKCHATGITRMRQGRDMCSTPAARLRPYGLAQHSQRSRPAFTRELLHFVCPLVSLHPGASRWTILRFPESSSFSRRFPPYQDSLTAVLFN